MSRNANPMMNSPMLRFLLLFRVIMKNPKAMNGTANAPMS